MTKEVEPGVVKIDVIKIIYVHGFNESTKSLAADATEACKEMKDEKSSFFKSLRAAADQSKFEKVGVRIDVEKHDWNSGNINLWDTVHGMWPIKAPYDPNREYKDQEKAVSGRIPTIKGFRTSVDEETRAAIGLARKILAYENDPSIDRYCLIGFSQGSSVIIKMLQLFDDPKEFRIPSGIEKEDELQDELKSIQNHIGAFKEMASGGSAKVLDGLQYLFLLAAATRHEKPFPFGILPERENPYIHIYYSPLKDYVLNALYYNFEGEFALGTSGRIGSDEDPRIKRFAVSCCHSTGLLFPLLSPYYKYSDTYIGLIAYLKGYRIKGNCCLNWASLLVWGQWIMELLIPRRYKVTNFWWSDVYRFEKREGKSVTIQQNTVFKNYRAIVTTRKEESVNTNPLRINRIAWGWNLHAVMKKAEDAEERLEGGRPKWNDDTIKSTIILGILFSVVFMGSLVLYELKQKDIGLLWDMKNVIITILMGLMGFGTGAFLGAVFWDKLPILRDLDKKSEIVWEDD